MKILRIRVIRAETCGGLLDGFHEDFHMRNVEEPSPQFMPLCLIGPNGSGKSQLLQIVAEMFQAIYAQYIPREERFEGNPGLLFEIEWLIWVSDDTPTIVRAARLDGEKTIRLHRKSGIDGEWEECSPTSAEVQRLLPWRVVGYTSGHNETLSLPFLQSRSAYADEVTRSALSVAPRTSAVPDTRLMLIDYGTHLEVLVANLLLGTELLREALLAKARVKDLHSFRCTVQLNHSAAPKGATREGVKGVQLTDELEQAIEKLRACSTCFDYQAKERTYVFDFLLDDSVRQAFQHHWPGGTLSLYSSLHKLAMLNDLVLPRRSREQLTSPKRERRFASRLPEPPDEHKVFRFERVNFTALSGRDVVDYVSLSDGEHQLMQILCTVAMVMGPSVVLLLDEPESHFNPQWRVEFISMLKSLPNRGGLAKQDCILTTHAPFVACDIPREQVMIFSKTPEGSITIRRPQIETFGSTFDTLLDECFGINPPISKVPRDKIERLLHSENAHEVKEGIRRLGHSVEKAFLSDHLRSLVDAPESKD